MAERTWRQRFSEQWWAVLDWLERLLTENKLLKVISVGLAALIWLVVSTQQERDRTLENVQLEVINRSEDRVVTQVPVMVVDVRVRGPWPVITNLPKDEVKVVVDVTGFEADNNVVWLRPEQVIRPPEVEVLRIDPPNVPITLEARLVRHVAVVPNIDLARLVPDRVLLTSHVSPATVEVSGPESRVRMVETVMTRPMDPLDHESPEPATVALVIPPGLNVSPASVKVHLVLDTVREREFVNLKPVWIPASMRTPNQTVAVTLRGPRTLLDKIEPSDIIVTLDRTKVPPTAQAIVPTVQMPEPYLSAVTVSRVKPEKVLLRSR